jgi:ArsR family transcriptional regulator
LTVVDATCTVVATKDVDVTTELPTVSAGPSAAACCAPPAGLSPALDAERIATIAKALSEPIRVQILDVVRRSDAAVCQCELIALFDIKQSLLSHHMKKLVESGLIDVERRHRWAYYSPAQGATKELIAWLS